MALGNNNGRKEQFSPTVYGYSMSNVSKDVNETTNLSFSMWKGVIKISIAPPKSQNRDSFIEWDREEAAVIYLNYSKSYMLADLIKKFIKDPDKYNGYGLMSSSNLVNIVKGEEFGKKGPCLIIRGTSDGNVIKSKIYEFKQNYYAAIDSIDTSNAKENFDIYKNIELLEVVRQLETYSQAMTNSFAFSVANAMNNTNSTIINGLYKIASNLGVELNSNYSKSKLSNIKDNVTKNRFAVNKEVDIEDLDEI